MQRPANERNQEENWLAQARSDAALPIKSDQPAASTVEMALEQAPCCNAQETETTSEEPSGSYSDTVDEVLETMNGGPIVEPEESQYQEMSAADWRPFAAASFLAVGALTVHAKRTRPRRRLTHDTLEVDEVNGPNHNLELDH
jgi:hypothetical protein